MVNWRQITDADREFIHDLCRKRYDRRYDFITSEAWLRNVVLKNPLIFLAIRNDAAFVVAHLHALPWTASEPEVDIMITCAEPGHIWEALELLRVSIEWARNRGAKKWRISSDSAYELGPLARRLGADELSPRYQLNL